MLTSIIDQARFSVAAFLDFLGRAARRKAQRRHQRRVE
jgi:hypothetical protein